MYNLDTNSMIQQTFAGMCKILKEKEDIMNKAVAIDMSMDFSLFSKLISGKRPITDKYRDKIFMYFNQDKYSKHMPELLTYLRETLNLSSTSMLYKRLASKSYTDLIRYLFYEFEEKDIEDDVDLQDLSVSYIRKYLSKILMEYPEKCMDYKIIDDEEVKGFEMQTNLSSHSIIELASAEPGLFRDNICVIVCPSKWHHENELLSNEWFVEKFSDYIIIRISNEMIDEIYTIDKMDQLCGQLAEVASIHIGRLCKNASMIAEMIVERAFDERE